MESTRLRVADRQAVDAAVVLLHVAAWLGGRWHPWPGGAWLGAALLASGAWLVAVDQSNDPQLAAAVAGGVGLAYVALACLARNALGLAVVGFAALHWLTGEWAWGFGGAGAAVVVAGVVLWRVADAEQWLEFAWVTAQSSLFGPGLALFALVTLQWPVVLQSWLLLAGAPFALLRVWLLRPHEAL